MRRLAILLFLLSSPCFAILSPLNQSLETIQTIIQSTDLQKHLPQDQPVLQIRRIANGYLLTTEKLQMVVEIQYIPIERPGKQQFKLIFQPPTELIRKG